MDNRVTFSIIIPAYNAEKYINKCIDSILKQKYQEYEVIIIDDGSEDKTAQIIDMYAENYKNIKVIHKENGGIGTAIPIGMTLAHNEYIIFVDSDDTIREDMLSFLNSKINECEEKIDIVQFGLEFKDLEGNFLRCEKPENYKLTEGGERILIDHFERFTTPSLACRCFSKHLFREIEYIDQNVGVDELLIVELLSKATSMISVDEVLYTVLVRRNSVSRANYSLEKIREYINLYSKLIAFAEKKKLSITNYIYIKYVKLLIELLRSMEKKDIKENCIVEIYKDYYKKVYKSKEYKKEGIVFILKNFIFYIFCMCYIE